MRILMAKIQTINLPPISGIAGQSQSQEGDQGNTGNAVGFKTVRRGADAVTRVIARTVGNNTRVFRIVFGKMENDFHQVGADVGNLREDTTADTQSGSTQTIHR